MFPDNDIRKIATRALLIAWTTCSVFSLGVLMAIGDQEKLAGMGFLETIGVMLATWALWPLLLGMFVGVTMRVVLNAS